MKTYIPTRKVVLPISGVTVELYSFLSSGEQRELQKLIMTSGTLEKLSEFDKMKEENNGDVSKLDPSAVVAIFDMQDLTFKLAFCAAYDKDQTKIDVTNPTEFLRDLHPKDGEALYSEVQEVMNGSSLNEDQKKN